MIIVTGLTRSGLSLTMQMLFEGGLPCVGHPPAFEHHDIGKVPWGKISGDQVAVKLVDGHIQLPPKTSDKKFNVIRLHRDREEQALSFNKFNRNISGLPPAPLQRLTKSFERNYQTIDRYFKGHNVLDVEFENLLADPLSGAMKISNWLLPIHPIDFDVFKAAAAVVSRAPECYPGFLEIALIRKYDGVV